VSFPTVEKNSTIIFPAQFMTTVQEAIALRAKTAMIGQELNRQTEHRVLAGPLRGSIPQTRDANPPGNRPSTAARTRSHRGR
jgi:hypothetical protein